MASPQRIYREADKLITKNKKTEKLEAIKQREIRCEGSVLSFFVDTELEAYKAAYQFRHGGETRVEYSKNLNDWYVTVDRAA